MKRVAALITVSFLAIFATGAAAQPAAPPTLSGEAFHDDTATITSAICFPDQPPFRVGGTFEAHGTATGPYPGNFQETGTAVTTVDTSGHVTSYDLTASFSIDSPVGQVTGTKHSTNFGTSCGPVDDPNATFTFNTVQGFAATDTYDARISTTSGAFADDGLFRAVLSRSFDESFSSALASPTPLLPTSKAQCENGGWQNYPQFKNQGQCVSFVETGR